MNSFTPGSDRHSDAAATTELHGLGPCSLCGRDPAAGFASIGDEWYCHGDDDPEPTCYMRAQQAIAVVGEFWPEILPPEARNV